MNSNFSRTLLTGIMLIAGLPALAMEPIEPQDSGYALDPRSPKDHALGQAADEGNEEDVQRLIELRAQVDSTNTQGATPLIMAAQNGHLGIVRILLDHGAKVNAQAAGANNLFALGQAAGNGHDAIVQLLLDRDAHIDMVNAEGVTPLIVAAQNGHLGIVERLLDHGATVNARSATGTFALGQAAGNGHDAIVKLLLDRHADANMLNAKGATPLICAAEDGYLEVVQILLAHEASVNTRSADGIFALVPAAANGYPRIVQLLLDHGADADMITAEGVTPLNFAAQNGHLEVVKILLDHGAHVNTQAANKTFALSQAAGNGHDAIVELLLNKGADVDMVNMHNVTPLMLGANYGHYHICKELIKSRANIHIVNAEGNTALNVAVDRNQLPIIKELIKAGADVNAQSGDHQVTPLIHATAKGYFGAAVLLLKNSANPNKATTQGVTALMGGASTNQPIICRLLINHGADILSQNIFGCSAFTEASLRNNSECMQAIISNAYFLEEIQPNVEAAQPDAPVMSNFEKLISLARDALSWVPGLSPAAPVKPIDRITTALLCMKRLNMPRDVQRLILCSLQEDMVAVLVPYIKAGKNIPPFAFKLMVDGIYHLTCLRLLPMIETAQQRVAYYAQQKLAGNPDYQWINACPENLLEIKEFDANYGTQLRETIKARVHELHVRKKSRYKKLPAHTSESIHLPPWNDHTCGINNFQ